MKNVRKDQFQTDRGHSEPLGVTHQDGGLNFALFSQYSTQVTLCLFSSQSKGPIAEIPLDPDINRTGWVWHILLKGLPEEQLEYAYRVDGPKEDPRNLFDSKHLLLDPYAKGLNSSTEWGHKDRDPESGAHAKVLFDVPFDWQGTKPPRIPMEELVIYEMHVRAFTQHPSSKTKKPGTFLGIIEKIPYLKSLGVNAIELLPIFEFDECLNSHTNPRTHQKLKNFWGYSTINFFSPMNRYASSQSATSAIDDFRTLVREMHKNGIEVILDVVYNHTGEGNKNGPVLSYKGIDNQVYYMVHPDGHYLDFSGTGNTVNANHPVVAAFILDSLRYWVSEMHVDGFRFDLASCLTRDDKGTPLPQPPVIHAITNDPILSEAKLIAEAWDAGGLYQVGSFPGEGRWAEWNGKYRDVVRRFIKGTGDHAGAFAKVMTGSQDLYGHGRRPYHSINFVTAHDGYTLRDLVTYQEKHNLENGEENRDGGNDNDSWNCGCEGPTSNRKVTLLREKQMRNLYAALMLSIGTPMILMGDEYGHTRNGNNNAYCQDNALNWFMWDELSKHEQFQRFCTLLNAFRKKNPLFHRKEFLKETDVEWHGHLPLKANWGSRFLAYTLKDPTKMQHLYIAFNADFQPAPIQLPPPPQGKKWFRVMDTSLSCPNDITSTPQATIPLKFTYTLPDYSSFVAQAL
ncbi:MAG: glycogen debranching protein GlgX [Candidatus Melainabacteria bacterium]|nr:glycogen debranching protein GlgX [Candidatus Melainabacteria bacterium]